MSTKRNGIIELLRFVFALIIVIFHINLDFWNLEKTYFGGRLSLAQMGGVGVEFFFIVSGFLFASSINRMQGEIDISRADIAFIWKKIKAILPYHLIACAFAFLFAALRYITGDKGIEILIDKIPSLFLLQAFQLPGSNEAFLGAEWYISTMLVVMFILFPFAVKFKDAFTGIVAPVVGLSLLSYNAMTNAALIGADHNLRGFQDICLGIGCFYVWTFLKDRELSKKEKVAVSIVETLCYVIVIAYCFSTANEKYQIYTALLLCAAVTLTFSGKGLVGECGFFNKKTFYLLGRWSIPIYLMQNPVRSGMQFIKEKGLLKVSDSVLAMVDFPLVIIAGIVVYYFYEYVKRMLFRTHEKSISDIGLRFTNEKD